MDVQTHDTNTGRDLSTALNRIASRLWPYQQLSIGTTFHHSDPRRGDTRSSRVRNTRMNARLWVCGSGNQRHIAKRPAP